MKQSINESETTHCNILLIAFLGTEKSISGLGRLNDVDKFTFPEGAFYIHSVALENTPISLNTFQSSQHLLCVCVWTEVSLTKANFLFPLLRFQFYSNSSPG